MSARDVVKIGLTFKATVVDGKPLCPCCSEPMRDRGDGLWDCPVWGPVLDRAHAQLADSIDRQLAKLDAATDGYSASGEAPQ